MGKKKPPEPKNDFAGEEALDVCSFSEEPIITGKCIASFSFSDDSTDKINEPAITLSNNNIATSESASTKTLDFNNSSSNNNNNTIAHADTNTNDIDNFNSNIANITEMDKNSSNTSTSSSSQLKALSNNKDILTDNRKTPIVNGC